MPLGKKMKTQNDKNKNQKNPSSVASLTILILSLLFSHSDFKSLTQYHLKAVESLNLSSVSKSNETQTDLNLGLSTSTKNTPIQLLFTCLQGSTAACTQYQTHWNPNYASLNLETTLQPHSQFLNNNYLQFSNTLLGGAMPPLATQDLVTTEASYTIPGCAECEAMKLSLLSTTTSATNIAGLLQSIPEMANMWNHSARDRQVIDQMFADSNDRFQLQCPPANNINFDIHDECYFSKRLDDRKQNDIADFQKEVLSCYKSHLIAINKCQSEEILKFTGLQLNTQI